jgi:hypothetical protein
MAKTVRQEVKKSSRQLVRAALGSSPMLVERVRGVEASVGETTLTVCWLAWRSVKEG